MSVALFFSYGTSLQDWRRMGLLSRQEPFLR